ncbi:MAG: hypothetical protein NC393_12170 [Clostridium sp.]|nr:hypothetical protein [Clostridium sp.]MCM1172863.1 hypothetical protein [Clostridium sp.]
MEYIRYMLENVEPLRIADDSTSQSGQTMTLRYIPGTTIRGFVINHIVNKNSSDFEANKKVLFSDKTRFMNAYLYVDEKELIPSPKGFYEDKTACEKKKIQNVVVSGDFDNGLKRAELGRYCYMEDDSIFYYGIRIGSDLKIKIKKNNNDKQQIFRSEYMEAGNTFVGYIAVEDPSVKEMIFDAFSDEIIIGNARSQGLGKCIVHDKQVVNNFRPYEAYAMSEDAQGSVYMMLLSHTVMRNSYGEYEGIDISQLAEKLGVTTLKIERASTSTVDVKGFNRTWGIKIPSVTMYEFGSVFKLTFDGVATKDKMVAIMESGVGVRRNEGFGQVIFLSDYEKIQFKQEGKIKTEDVLSIQKHAEDEDVLRAVAKMYYLKRIRKAMEESIISRIDTKGISKSKVGNVRAQLEANRYNAIKGTKIINEYFKHEVEKEESQKKQSERAGIEPFMSQVLNILGMNRSIKDILDYEDAEKKVKISVPNDEVMTVPVKFLLAQEEIQQLKFEYIIKLMQYDNREGDK